MKVIIAGSRDIIDYSEVEKAVEESGFEITEVVSGKADGVDTLGERWADEHGVPVKPFPAKWASHGKAAGRWRNREMSLYADALVAVWDGNSNGTHNMIGQMKFRSKPSHVRIVGSKKVLEKS
jgi:hypothetical protein